VAIASETARPYFDLNRINKCFWAGEFVSIEAAAELVITPREGTGAHPFKKANKQPKKSGPTPKKLKPNPSESQSEGTKILKVVVSLNFQKSSFTFMYVTVPLLGYITYQLSIIK
jgi:hypothetical protein